MGKVRYTQTTWDY